MKKPIIYTTPTCVYCHALMDWLDSKEIEYETKDITEPAVEDEASRALGYKISTVPTTLIGDEVIVGFDRPAFTKALEKVKAA
ncbi:MAG: glutaredoxin family protein [Candidatus Nomurabacteria bacterium]|jgi:glutaredoxin|nr:glutaredoxin family protein [Candidatus Nomurabacteria bacterium]